MTIWVRILVTIVVMLVVSFLAGLLWQSIFGGTQIPSYMSGLIGGLAAIPVWEILQKFKADPHKKK